MKFNGDDTYSYALFYRDDVCGMDSPISYSPHPIVCGMSYHEAWKQKKRMDDEDKVLASIAK